MIYQMVCLSCLSGGEVCAVSREWDDISRWPGERWGDSSSVLTFLSTLLFIRPEYVMGSATMLPQGFYQNPQQHSRTTASSGLYLPGRRVSVHAHILTHTHTTGTVYYCIQSRHHRLISGFLRRINTIKEKTLQLFHFIFVARYWNMNN